MEKEKRGGKQEAEGPQSLIAVWARWVLPSGRFLSRREWAERQSGKS